MTLIRNRQPLTTVAAVIEALGGNDAVYALASVTPQQVTNWRSAGRFSSTSYVLFTEALERIGRSAEPALWGMKPSAKPKSDLNPEAAPA